MPLELRIVGGCARIGARNCSILRDSDNGVALMSDCGGAQTNETFTGLELMDFRAIDTRELKAVLVTHGHLDHMGGLDELALYLGPKKRRDQRWPLLGSMYTQGCISHEFINNIFRDPGDPRIDDTFDRRDINGVPYIKKPFEVQSFALDHTIPQATGLLTYWAAPGGRRYKVLNLGDFRQEEQWQRIKHDAQFHYADVLLLDSSGALSPGSTPPEQRGVDEIVRIIEMHPRQDVIVAGFSTNAVRWGKILAHSHQQRRVAVAGFSMKRKLRLASDMSIIEAVPEVSLPQKYRSLTLMTGAQAEKDSALWRYVYGTGSYETFDPSVVIVLSARVIPGNEEEVRSMLEFARRQMNGDGRIYASMNSPEDIGAHEHLEVSPSGHCCADNLAEALRDLKPKCVVPVHGGPKERQANAEIARSMGIEVVMLEDGDVYEIAA